MNLTPKQLEVVRVIWQHRKKHGLAPSLSEIATALGVTKITAWEHVGLLEKKGAILREKYQKRSLRLSRSVVRELEAVEGERDEIREAVEAEREACAKVAADHEWRGADYDDRDGTDVAVSIRDEIRARGKEMLGG